MGKYSVLMSVYYKENPEFLMQSMESIFAQTLLTDDFVLVCDGPLTTELDAVIDFYLKKYDSVLQIVRLEQNVGLATALNEGLRYCKNELVARMDSDDYAMPERCALQLNAFSDDSDLDVVGGFIAEFEGNVFNIVSKKTMPCSHSDILRYAKKRSPFNHPTVMYRKSSVLSAGGYPNLPLHEDYALWVNMLMAGFKGYNISEVLCNMRVDSGMYARRGGLRYCKTAVSFRKYMLKNKFCNLGEFLLSSGGIAVACLVPTGIRKWLYKHFLRRGNTD